MAAKLQCEICGGRLVGKPGGVFECESCGMEFSTEWAKAKIQEIQGTVKVEGTVEVKGSVRVENPVKVEGAVNTKSLISRGNLALEDEKWDEAKKCFNDALNTDPENAEAYLGLAMAKKRNRNRDEYEYSYWFSRNGRSGREISRAKQFAQGELKEWFDSLDEEIALENARQQELEEQAAAKEESARKELTESKIDLVLAPLRERAERYQKHLITGEFKMFGLKSDGTVVTTDSYYQSKVSGWTDIIAVAKGSSHIVGLKTNGTVVAVGDNDKGQCNVVNWTDIVSIAVGLYHTVGLKRDGTVLATGANHGWRVYFQECQGQCETEDWKDIIAIAANSYQTFGLKKDGTVCYAGEERRDRLGEYTCETWTNIASIKLGYGPVGLKKDGTVIKADLFNYKNCDTSKWRDIVSIAARDRDIAGLTAYGTVKFTSGFTDTKINVEDWSNIVAIDVGDYHIVGLKADGTVVAKGKNEHGECDVSGWRDIVAIKAGYYCTFGLKSDGTVVAVGEKDQCNVTGWKLFRTEAEINAEKTSLQTELANLKGIFSGRRRKQIETRLAQLDDELSKL